MVNEKILIETKKYVSILNNVGYNLSSAYLFGSYAKGTERTDSDLDLAVVMKIPMIDRFEERVKLMKIAVRNNNYIIEPHPFTEEEFEEGNPFIDEIKRTGIRIV